MEVRSSVWRYTPSGLMRLRLLSWLLGFCCSVMASERVPNRDVVFHSLPSLLRCVARVCLGPALTLATVRPADFG